MVTDKNKYFALLDYDGFICKSYYANKEDIMDLENARQILEDLTECAQEKAADFFGVKKNDVKVLRIMSGHSWKKDIYPSYKQTRKRDEYLGVYRTYVKENMDVTLVPQLEADEVLVVLKQFFDRIPNKKCIIFSDDKDLRYYSSNYCKINITEEVQELDDVENWTKQLEQMLIGDSQDNIKGIPKVGEATAPKLLNNYGYNINGVIQAFKDKNVDIDNCLRDLLLVVPMSSEYVEDKSSLNDLAIEVLGSGTSLEVVTYRCIEAQVQYLNKKVKEIYERRKD